MSGTETAAERKRETIGSRLGFIMLAAGCAIGLGNVWRFPYVAGTYGGAFFVILYLIFLVILGFPVMVMELSAGRAAGLGLYGAFGKLAAKGKSLWTASALTFFSGNLLLMMMYTTVTGWMLAYFYFYITGGMAHVDSPEATAKFFGDFISSPWKSAAAMAAATAIGTAVCAAGLRNGVERSVKILMACLFIVIAGLSIHAVVALPGAKEGLSFYLVPSWERFSEHGFLAPVSAAMSQAFFTLGLGIGSIMIFGSYISKERSLTHESMLIIICDTMVALLSGVVIFPACFSYGVEVSSGPGLVLVSLTSIFNHMPGGRWWGALFFLFISVAAITTVITVFENIIAYIIDEWHLPRPAAALVNGAAVFLFSLPCALGYSLLSGVHPFGGDSTILDFEDWLVSDNLLPLGALAIVLFCTWRKGWGWDAFVGEADKGKGMTFPKFAKYYITAGLPLLIIALFAIGIYARFFR